MRERSRAEAEARWLSRSRRRVTCVSSLHPLRAGHPKVRTQLAIFTGPAPALPRYRAAVAATRWRGGGEVSFACLALCPAHFHCPPKVSVRINAHIPASSLLRCVAFFARSLSLSLFLSFSLSLAAPLYTRAFFIARCLVVACPSVNFECEMSRVGEGGGGGGGGGERETPHCRHRHRFAPILAHRLCSTSRLPSGCGRAT